MGGAQCLKDQCGLPQDVMDDSSLVADYLTESGSWNWDGDPPNSVKEQLELVPINNDVEDQIDWALDAFLLGPFPLVVSHAEVKAPVVKISSLVLV